MSSRLPLEEITLDAILEGRVTIDHLRVTADALHRQSEIAAGCGRPQLAENLQRAAELVDVPESRILEVYSALRPGRGNPELLASLANEMEHTYGATRCAELIREAAGL